MTHPHSGGRTRRRGAALEAALLDAAWDELQVTGYQAMTMEAVADRAGTSRAVLYRRWPKRAELVVATLRRHRRLALTVRITLTPGHGTAKTVTRTVVVRA